jgi:hypothetical protein
MTTTTVKMTTTRMIPDHDGTSGQARGQFSRACSARWLDGSGVVWMMQWQVASVDRTR